MITAISIILAIAIGNFFLLRHNKIKAPLIWSLLFFLISSGVIVGYILILGDRPPADAVTIKLKLSPSLSQNDLLLPSDTTTTTEKSKIVIKYCPDNTCDIIEAPASVDKAAFEDFAVLYFSYASGYIYLDKSFDGKTPYRQKSQDKANEIVSRLRRDCNGDDLAVVSCILLRLIRDYKIKIASSRYDEGVEAVAPFEPQEKLSEKKLRAVQDWYKKQ
jgi:hypothetical protein